MRETKEILLAAMIAISAPVVAQENIAPHLEQLPQRMQYNPAMTADNMKYFTVPIVSGGFNVSAENTAFRYEDMFTRGHDDTLRLDFGRLHDRMRKTNYASVSANIPIFEFGRRTHSCLGYMSFALSNKTMIETKYDRNFTLLWRGNWDYDKDEPINHRISNIFVRGMNYMELSGGYSHRIPSIGLRMGVRVKLLAGIVSVLSDDLTIDFQTRRESDRYSVVMRSSGSIKTSLPMDVEIGEDGYVSKVSLDADEWKLEPMKNRGVAFDLGGTMDISEKLKVGLAFVDFGFINWNDGCHRFEAGTSCTFRGIDISADMKTGMTEDGIDGAIYWKTMKDSLMRFRDVSHTTHKYKTRLSSRMIATADLFLMDWLQVGGTVATKFVGGQAFTRGGATAVVHGGSWLSFAATAAINPGWKVSPGAGLVLTGGPVQGYVIVDRFPRRLSEAQGASLTFGINFVLGRKKYSLIEDAHKMDVRWN